MIFFQSLEIIGINEFVKFLSIVLEKIEFLAQIRLSGVTIDVRTNSTKPGKERTILAETCRIFEGVGLEPKIFVKLGYKNQMLYHSGKIKAVEYLEVRGINKVQMS